MLVSALLTSLAINSGLCVLFFTLYSILRKQPSNYEVYIPRLLAEGESDKSGSFNLERLIPSPYWVKRAWQLTEDDLLSSSGLDAVVFMRLINFSLRVFMFAGVIGIFVLLPVNCSGNQLEYIDFTDLSNNSLDVFTISNVNNGSSKLWIHFAAVYLVTIFVCCLLYYIYVMLLVLMLLLPWKANYAREIRILLSLEFRYISQRRLDYFQSSKPQPHQFTILVRSIPVPSGSSVGEKVDSFFREYHPSTYLSHIVVRRTNKIKKLLNDAKKLYTRLLHLQSVPNQQKYTRSCCFGLFGRKVNLVEQYEKKLEDAEENVRLEQSEASLGGDEVRSAFVSFKSRYGAAIAHHLQQSTNPTNWVTEQAPEPRDVYWPFFSSSFIRRWLSKLVVIFLCIVLTIVFLIPVVLVQGLTNLNQLEAWLPFLKNVLTITFVSQVITGYLPSLILLLFLKIVPPTMEFFSSIQGYVSLSDIQKSACSKVLWFTIWNIFFATVFSGSVLSKVYLFLDPKNIPSKLGLSVPAQSSFFIAYVVTSGWTSTSSELFRIIPLIWSLLKRPFTDSKDDEFEVPAMNYHNHMPRVLFFVLLGITYFFLAPLILPFLLVYLCLGFIIFRNQFINVYAPRFETAGKFWPIVHNSMIFSLVLMHAIAVGIFSIKNVNLASTLIFPLPVFTLIFNEYCRKRFLPNFVAYPAESLIRKDRQDENDPAMPEFLDKLVTVYQDPALMPINYSGSNDRLRSPLLSSAPQA